MDATITKTIAPFAVISRTSFSESSLTASRLEDSYTKKKESLNLEIASYDQSAYITIEGGGRREFK